MMNRWNISETTGAVDESEGTHLNYEVADDSESNISPPPYQAGKPESVVFPPPSFSPDEKWVKEYVEQFGQEPSFF